MNHPGIRYNKNKKKFKSSGITVIDGYSITTYPVRIIWPTDLMTVLMTDGSTMTSRESRLGSMNFLMLSDFSVIALGQCKVYMYNTDSN